MFGNSTTVDENIRKSVSSYLCQYSYYSTRHHVAERRRKIEFANQNPIDINSEEASWITVDAIEVALSSFSNKKAGGADKQPPILLKKLGRNSLIRICAIFRASYMLGLLPPDWLEVIVCYIPKSGKKSYIESGSWRPISLMIQLYKLFEKVQLNHARFNSKIKNRHYRQKGFRTKMGTEHALSNVTETIESALLQRGYCLAVSLDAKGAFNEISFESVLKNMKRIEVDNGIIKLNEDFLKNRRVNFTHKGVSLSVYCIGHSGSYKGFIP